MKYKTHLLNIFIAIFLLFLVIAKFEFKFSIKIYLFLRSTRLMILTFDFLLPLQYYQSTIYFLLALIPVKSRLFPPRISTMVSKLISYTKYPRTDLPNYKSIFFIFSWKSFDWIKKKSWKFSFGSVWIGCWINSVSKIWVTWKMYGFGI